MDHLLQHYVRDAQRSIVLLNDTIKRTMCRYMGRYAYCVIDYSNFIWDDNELYDQLTTIGCPNNIDNVNQNIYNSDNI